MLRISALTFLLLFFQVESGFPCKCAFPGPDIKNADLIKDAYQESDSIFLGQCIKAEFMEIEGADPEQKYYVQYTFHVQQIWKCKSKYETIIVKTGMGFGDCGFEFRPGFSYIVYGYDKMGSVATNICTRTLMAGFYPYFIKEEAKTEIQTLDSLKR